MISENAVRSVILGADDVVVRAMEHFLHTSRAGGLSRETSDLIMAHVVTAAGLGYFSVGLAFAAARIDDKSPT